MASSAQGIIAAVHAAEDEFASGDRVTLGDVARAYPVLAEAINRLFITLSDYDRARIALLAVSICGACHNAPADCQCWNDE